MTVAAVAKLTQGVGSQGLNSLSNVALVIAVARTSTPEEFGAFSIAYTMASLVVPVLRSSVGETLVVTNPEEKRAAIGASLLVGSGFAVGMAASAVLASGSLAGWMLAMAAALPLLVLHDASRFVGFALTRPQVAVKADLVWVSVQAGTWTAAIVLGYGSVATLFGLWVVGAGAAIASVRSHVGAPALSEGLRWMRLHRRLASGFALDRVMGLGPPHATLYVIGGVVGLPAAGAMRGMQTLYGFYRPLLQGAASVALPEAVERKGTSRTSMIGYAARVSAALTALAVAAVMVLALLPESIGRQILDDTWPLAGTVAIPMGLPVVAAAALMGTTAVFRALHATRTLLTLRAFTAVTATAAGVAGAVFGGLHGAAWTLGVAQLATIPVGWIVAVRARDQTTRRAPPTLKPGPL